MTMKNCQWDIVMATQTVKYYKILPLKIQKAKKQFYVLIFTYSIIVIIVSL